jgi:hypothetical protein
MRSSGKMYYFVEHDVPAHKRLLIPRRILDALRAKEGEYIYLEVNRWRHPVALCHRSVSIPAILREKIGGNKTVEFSVEKIKGKSIYFLACIKLHKKHNSHFDLHVHRCARKTKVMEIEIDGKKFLGGLERDRITIGRRVLRRLDLQAEKIYQVRITPTRMSHANNSHLFSEGEPKPLSECICENRILLDKALGHLNLRKLDEDTLEVNYSLRNKDSRGVRLPSSVDLTNDLFFLFGLFKADGTKTHCKYFCLSNTNAELIKFFIDTTSSIFRQPRSEWRVEAIVSTGGMPRANLIDPLASYLGIPRNRISVYSVSSRGSLKFNAKIEGRTINEIMLVLLKGIEDVVLDEPREWACFLSGILAGDGYLCTERTRIKRIELYFDPNKKTDEALLYLKMLRKLGLQKFAVRIYYPRNDRRRRVRAIRIAVEMRRIFTNVKTQQKSKIFGLGGTIFIYSKEDIRKLSPYNLFYPNIRYNKTFYRLWK